MPCPQRLTFVRTPIKLKPLRPAWMWGLLLLLLTFLPRSASAETPRGHALIVRGIFTVFSLGMDELGEKLTKQKYAVEVVPSVMSLHAAQQMIDRIKAEPKPVPVIIIGHSLGGDLAPKLAERFASENVPVDMLIMLDSTMPSAPPANVRCCINLYQSNYSPSWFRVFRGTDIESSSTNTKMINIDIRKWAAEEQTASINHFNIDSDPWIHSLVIRAVESVVLPDTIWQSAESNPAETTHLGLRAPIPVSELSTTQLPLRPVSDQAFVMDKATEQWARPVLPEQVSPQWNLESQASEKPVQWRR